MRESEMEELIAKFPDELFGEHRFVLKGRQQSFSGVGRFDLLFSGPYETNILMELKARVAQYPDATQLAKYKEALEHKGEKNILMWLVTPQVPNTVREVLDSMRGTQWRA
jgi:RecB family endonuclease NucS